jgi:hypothetical protein
MLNRRVGFHSVVAVTLCALLSFLSLLTLIASNDGPLAFLGLVAILVCPAKWLTILLSNDRESILAQWVKRARARPQSSTPRDTERQAHAGRRGKEKV